jgi:hypothetical protein
MLRSLTFFLAFATITSLQAKEEPKKEIYAHFMGCFPALRMAAWQKREQGKEIWPGNISSAMAMQGGRFANLPLISSEWFSDEENLRRSCELEIRRAMRIGLDGFAIDAWAGGDGAKKVFETMLDVCKEKQLPFSVTLCLDPACHGPAKTDIADDNADKGSKVAAITETLRYLLKYKDHPNLARREGKVLIFTYQTCSIMSMALKNEGAGADEPKRWRNFLVMLQGLRDVARKEFNTELFVHMDMDYSFPGGIDLKNIAGSRPPHQPGPMIADMAAYLAKGEDGLEPFDAIGGFTGISWEQERELVAEKVQAAGGEWASPLMHQYNSKGGAIHVAPGTDRLRAEWDSIRRTGSTLLQYVTWNDYGEDTSLAPATETRYTISDLTAYHIAWWKNGKPPEVDRDKVYLIYRRYPEGAKIFPFHARRHVESVLEVTTLLKEPATIRLPGRSESYEAPAGMFVKQFPLTPGEVAAEVVRDGKVTLSVVSPDPITDKPWREANEMICYSSEFDRLWEMDFPGTKPEPYAENGDDDKDGLPNWFEMLWFGKVGDYATATGADANADPDGDGLTNLQEYQQQSDPLKKTVAYEPGYVWDFAAVYDTGISFNPDPDTTGRRPWHYFYKVEEHPVPLDGEYKPIPSAALRNIPYAGEMSHHTPPENDKLKDGYGWVSRRKNPSDDSWMTQLRPYPNVAVMVAWESPIAGIVSLDLKTKERTDARNPATLTIQRTGPFETLEEQEISRGEPAHIEKPSIAVKPGDRIYIVGSSRGQDVLIEDLKIKLVSLDGQKSARASLR